MLTEEKAADDATVVSANAARQLRATVRSQPEAAPPGTGIIAGATSYAAIITEQASGAPPPPQGERIAAAPAGEVLEQFPEQQASPAVVTRSELPTAPAAPTPAAMRVSFAQPAAQSDSGILPDLVFAQASAPLAETPTAEAGGSGQTVEPPLTPPRAAEQAAPAPRSRIILGEASGAEDETLALDVTLLDAPEGAGILVTGLPPGASLSAGARLQDGSWLVSGSALAGLTLIPGANWSGEVVLSLRVVSGGLEPHPGDTVARLPIRITGTADAPELAANAAAGREDTAIALDIRATLTDQDGSETLGIRIEGVPPGAMLSAGTRAPDGSWQLTPEQLAGLTITPPRDFSGELLLSVTATSQEAGSDTASRTVAVAVSVAPVMESTARLEAGAAVTEDHWAPISFRLETGDASESLALETRVEGLPAGAMLSQGTLGSDGAWTVSTAALLAGEVAMRAPTDSDATLTLTFRTEVVDTAGTVIDRRPIATTSEIRVAAVADAPLLQAGAVSGLEDRAIALNLGAALRDGDGSESLAISLLGVPGGASLSAGQRLADGSWSVPAEALPTLTLTPPADFAGSIALTLRATATEAANGSTATTEQRFTLQVDPVVDGGTLSASASGREDTAIALNARFDASPDASEQWEPTAVIRGVPDGASLNQGRALGGGAWEVDQRELAAGRVLLTPPEDSDADIALTIEARITDSQGGSASRDVTAAFTLRVDAVADAPDARAEHVTGREDAAVALDLSAALTDLDGSETLTLRIEGVPMGATLSHGTRESDGAWSVAPADLAALSLTPPRDHAGDIRLTLVATATEQAGGSATTRSAFTITVTPEADAARITASGSGEEDSWITIRGTLATTDLDGSERIGDTIIIRDVPTGAALSHGTETSPGTWSVPRSAFEAGELAIRPPADSDADFNLRITVTAEDGASRAETSATIPITVRALADAPDVQVANSVGREDTAIRLTDLGATLTDTDGSESLSLVIAGVPSGATLSHGTRNSNGTWTVSQADLAEIRLTPPLDYAGDIRLELRATSTEGTGGAATTVGAITLTVTPEADAARIIASGSGDEDRWISIRGTLATTDLDGSERIGDTITIRDVPAGAALSHGTETSPGTWSVPRSVFDAGQLAILPPRNSDADFNLRISVTTEDGASRAETSGTIPITVRAIADAPDVQVANSTGGEDRAIRLTGLGATLTDTDGSESLSFVIAGVPSGAILSHGTRNSNGTWTISQADLTQVSLTPPRDYAGEIRLELRVSSTEGAGGSATTTAAFTITVTPEADAARITASGSGEEDRWISILGTLATTDADGSERIGDTITIRDVPPGASLNHGNETSPGTWSVPRSVFDAGQLAILPPRNSDADFNLRITVTTEDGASRAETSATIPITVRAVADAPDVQVTNSTGGEDRAIRLTGLGATLTDTDGSESLSFVIAGVPSGATLSHGTRNSNGTWTISQADLTQVSLTPPPDYAGDIRLELRATSTEVAGGSATSVGAFTVTVAPEADAARITTSGSGEEDSWVAIRGTLATTDADGSERVGDTITILDVPAGATLSHGTQFSPGTWSVARSIFDAGQLAIRPPADSDADFNLRIIVTTEDGASRTETTATIPVTVRAVADAPDVTIASSTGSEDQAIRLNGLSGALTDTDGSESLSFVITGMPSGATLSHGTRNSDGSWNLTPADVAQVSLTPPRDFAGQIQLTLTAVATEAEPGAAASRRSANFIVTVDAIADAGAIAGTATGREDEYAALQVSFATPDADGSESWAATTRISGLPPGATLSQGQEVSPGVWEVSTAALRQGQVGARGAANSDADFTLTIETTLSDSANGRTDARLISGTAAISLTAVADAPTVTAGDVAGLEDRAIALDLRAALTDTDGSETLSLRIEGVPEGALLSAGTRDPDGSWSVTPTQLTGLTLTPLRDFSGEISLTIEATATDHDGSRAVTRSGFTVSVDAVADVAGLRVANAVGQEDSTIALRIAGWTTDTDGSERLQGFRLLDVPHDVGVSAGGQALTRGLDGSFWVPADAAGTLRVTPPANSDRDFTLRVTAVAEEPNGSRSESPAQSLTVWVNAVADTPVWSHVSTTGVEDSAIALNLGARLTDTDGSERLSFLISGVPEGALLSAGTYTGPGSWSLTAEEAATATITPPRDFAGSINLSVTAVGQEQDGGSTAVSTRNVTVQVTAAIDTRSDGGVSRGSEDTAVTLDLVPALGDRDGSERLVGTLEISGVPGDATLRLADGRVVAAEGGVHRIDVRDMAGVTLTPGGNSDADPTLTIRATVEDTGGVRATVTRQLRVEVQAVADAPLLTVEENQTAEERALAAKEAEAAQAAQLEAQPAPEKASLSSEKEAMAAPAAQVEAEPAPDKASLSAEKNAELGWSPLGITASLTDTDGSETLHVWVRDVPEGFALSAGTPAGNGTWLLRAEELKGLAIHALAGEDRKVTLRVQAVATEAEGGTAKSDADLTLLITKSEGGDPGGGPASDPSAPKLGLGIGDVQEDGRARVKIEVYAQGKTDTITVLIEDLPEGARPSAGTYDPERKLWVLRAEELEGLTISLPPDAAGEMAFKVSAVATDPSGRSATAAEPATFHVDAVADGAWISAAPGRAVEDGGIALNLSIGAADRDGSEAVTSITISNLTAGASILPAAGIQDRGDGSWQVEAWALGQVRVQPPGNAHGSVALTVTATTREASNGTTATSSRRVSVEVEASPDAPTVTAANASGREDTAIALSLSAALVDRDGSEVLSVVIRGLPQGALLSAGINNGDGSWTLQPGELPGLTATPPRDWTGRMELTLEAHAMERSTGAVATTRTTFQVGTTAVADRPIGDVAATANGAEDSAIPIEITAALTDRDGSESLFVVITGMPAGGRFSAGAARPDGSWEVPGAALPGLSFTPPGDFSGQLDLTVRVVAREADGSEASSSFPLSVTVAGVADAPLLTAAPALGDEDAAVALNIGAQLTDTDGSESIARYSIAGVPAGASLSAGQRQPDGSWTLNPSEIAGLQLNPPPDFAGEISLTVTATSREAVGGSEASTSRTLTVTLNAVADAPVVVAGPATGREDHAVALNLSAALTDTDGSETLDLRIEGVPAGGALSHGTRNPDGSWSVAPADLAALALSPPADFAGDLRLTLVATDTEGNGSSATTRSSFAVTVAPEADAARITVSGSGDEDRWIGIRGTLATTDVDSSERIGDTLTIRDVPLGASLSHGTETSPGTWSVPRSAFDAGQLAILPPRDSDADFNLRISVTTEDGASRAETSATIPIAVLAVADAPVVVAGPATGDEDHAVALNLSAAVTDTDGSETLSLRIAGVPDGFSLSAGTPLGGGVWSVPGAQLASLSLSAPQDWNGTLNLTLEATAAEGGGTATTTRNFSVTLTPQNDAPVLSLTGGRAAAMGEARVNLLADAAATDVDSAQMGGATISLAGAAPGEALGFDGHALVEVGGRTMIGGTGIELTRGPDGSVTLSGAAPTSTYTDVLESLTLETANPGGLAAGTRQIQVTLRDDAGLASATQAVSLAVTPSVITGDGSSQTLLGTAGHDSFVGSAGNETMQGGAGADVFTLTLGGGQDRVDGGDGSWIDRLNIQGAGAPSEIVGPGQGGVPAEGGWTVMITNGAAPTQGDHSLDFTQPASGQILFADGGQVEFTAIERITW